MPKKKIGVNETTIVDSKKQSINSINEDSQVWFESIDDPLTSIAEHV